MCGIVGYIGNKQAWPILIKGLKRLEYRGYDSAGIALIKDKANIYKCKGKVSDLEVFAEGKDLEAVIGMGHTRWATHGEPNNVNAHPHESMHGYFVVIHNGIIENYDVIKQRLEEKGYTFKSETDTEVLANLFEYIYIAGRLSVEETVRLALNNVIGAYGLVIACKETPDQLIAARKGSPLVIGIGTDEYFIASDASPIVENTNSVVYLNNDNIAIIKKGELSLKTVDNTKLTPKVEKLDLKLDEIEKGDFEHYMLKEIYEQPKAITDTFRGRIASDLARIKLGGIEKVVDKISKARRLILIGCGTSWHACLVGEYFFEEFARIPVEVEYASEFRYRNPVIFDDDVVIAVSQSGETADTLAAIQLAKSSGATVIGICNVVGSSIARETHAGVYTHAGTEIGVASTKAFTAQVTVFAMMAAVLGKTNKALSDTEYTDFIKELSEIPEKIKTALKGNDTIKGLAALYKDAGNFLYLGRGYLFPVALEGALKLKEISYIHAEGYPAAEMKHGPIALIDESMPVVVLATKDKSYEKVISNIQEIKARSGKVIAIVSESDNQIETMADHIIKVPDGDFALMPLLTVIPLQLLSYHIAVMRGCNVDQPRNLAKSVTVE